MLTIAKQSEDNLSRAGEMRKILPFRINQGYIIDHVTSEGIK